MPEKQAAALRQCGRAARAAHNGAGWQQAHGNGSLRAVQPQNRKARRRALLPRGQCDQKRAAVLRAGKNGHAALRLRSRLGAAMRSIVIQRTAPHKGKQHAQSDQKADEKRFQTSAHTKALLCRIAWAEGGHTNLQKVGRWVWQPKFSGWPEKEDGIHEKQ